MFATHRRWLAAPVLLALVLLLSACTDDPAADEGTGNGDSEAAAEGQEGQEGSTLQQVQDRGTLNCGVNDAVPGFGSVTPEGDFEGFDVDYCKAVAAAVMGDPEAVEFIPLTAEQRFTALQAGEIDVLIRNTTWTVSRDTGEGATFAHTTFYDGQGMMVRAEDGYQQVADMGGTTVCVLSGTTTELNLETEFARQGLDYEPLTLEDNDVLQQAFQEGRCDGWTSDKSQLAGVRSEYPDNLGGPDSLVVLDETFSKEPLGPATRDGDQQWSQIVDWVVNVTIQAEEFEITQANVGEMASSDNPDIVRLVAGEDVEEGGVFDDGLGLEPGWPATVIEAVGNYGEIYDRNVGPDTPLGLDRAENALWTDGGLQYAIPYR
jgi:general L-amino acid transport system substrate-binding protein